MFARPALRETCPPMATPIIFPITSCSLPSTQSFKIRSKGNSALPGTRNTHTHTRVKRHWRHHRQRMRKQHTDTIKLHTRFLKTGGHAGAGTRGSTDDECLPRTSGAITLWPKLEGYHTQACSTTPKHLLTLIKRQPDQLARPTSAATTSATIPTTTTLERVQATPPHPLARRTPLPSTCEASAPSASLVFAGDAPTRGEGEGDASHAGVGTGT